MIISSKLLKEIIVQAHNKGWCDYLAGDEVKSIDSQTDEQIVESVMTNTLIHVLSDIMTKHDAEIWINETNTAFGNKTPLEIWTIDPSKIEQMIGQILNNVAN